MFVIEVDLAGVGWRPICAGLRGEWLVAVHALAAHYYMADTAATLITTPAPLFWDGVRTAAAGWRVTECACRPDALVRGRKKKG